MTIQVLAGFYRPPPTPAKKSTNADVAIPNSPDESQEGPRFTLRQLWEITHKIMGALTLILGFYQIYSGFELYEAKYGVKFQEAVFWVFTVLIMVALLALFALRLYKQGAMKSFLPGKKTSAV